MRDAKKPNVKETARMLRDYSQNGLRPITIISNNRKPLRDFVVTYISEEGGGYLAGHEKAQRRIQTIKFSEIEDVRI